MDIGMEEMHTIAVKTLPSGKEESIMTLAERLREEGKLAGLEEGKLVGLEEGKLAGLEEGERKGRRTFLERQLRKRFTTDVDDPHIQEKLQAATTEQLDTWAERIIDAESIEQVFAD